MKCNTEGCNNDARKSRRYCHTCKNKKYREKYPVLAAYHNLKQNAKRRNVFFALTYQFFKMFCKETNYIQLRGNYGDDLTIDRVKPKLGYVDGNIQAITRIENSIKQHIDAGKFWNDYYDVHGIKMDKPIEVEIDKDKVPF